MSPLNERIEQINPDHASPEGPQLSDVRRVSHSLAVTAPRHRRRRFQGSSRANARSGIRWRRRSRGGG